MKTKVPRTKFSREIFLRKEKGYVILKFQRMKMPEYFTFLSKKKKTFDKSSLSLQELNRSYIPSYTYLIHVIYKIKKKISFIHILIRKFNTTNNLNREGF